MIHAVRERRRQRERRKDSETARKIDMALLTSKAFDTKAGYTYALLAGITPDLVHTVFNRPLGCIRLPKSGIPENSDRRIERLLN